MGYTGCPHTSDDCKILNGEDFDLDRYEFPYILAQKIGLRKEQIGFLKKLGCPFLGKKTTLRILRDFAKERAFFESCERAKKSRSRW